MGHCECETRVDATAINEHRARAALPAVATLFGAVEPDVFAQRVEQRDARLEQQIVVVTVDVESNGPRGHAAFVHTCLRLR